MLCLMSLKSFNLIYSGCSSATAEALSGNIGSNLTKQYNQKMCSSFYNNNGFLHGKQQINMPEDFAWAQIV